MPVLDLSPDELLTTTRSVRRRLDCSRPVEPEVIKQCLEIALQAPTGGNRQGWHFVVVTDAKKRQALGDLYRRGFAIYRNLPSTAGKLFADDPQRASIQQRVRDSAEYLAAHMHEVPVHLILCINGRFEELPIMQQAGLWGSILPATWSFMLAARARGLGTSWTTIHLFFEQEAAELLSIPYTEVTQAALIPVAYTEGLNFTPATREPLQCAEDVKAYSGLNARQSSEQILEAQLSRHNLEPADIGYLVHTHLHLDHCGLDDRLPNARILVQRAELQYAAAPLFPVPFYDRQDIAKLVGELWNRVELLDGESELFPGIRTVTTRGHTPAHQMIYVEVPSGTAIITGDAAYIAAINVKQQVPFGYYINLEDVMAGLRRIAREGKHVLPTHDAEVYKLYPEGIR